MLSGGTKTAFRPTVSFRAVLRTFLRLGCPSFGSPVAHLGYFREEFVVRRRWCTEQRYADLRALCRLLPGPTSSQVALGIRFLQTGVGGAVAAWLHSPLGPPVAAVCDRADARGPADQRPVLEGGLHGLRVVAVPDPLFSFTAYLGAVLGVGPGGLSGGALCPFAIFCRHFCW